MGRWLAAGAWTAVLLAASSDLFSSSHTGGILRSLLGGLLSPEVFAWVHWGLRKLGHLTGYGIASVLYYRALAGAGTRRAEILALLLVLVVASVDEVHQSTIPSRTGTPVDVLIDLTGGTIAQLLLRVEWRRRTSHE